MKSGGPINMPVMYFEDFISVSTPLSGATANTVGMGTFSVTADRADWLTTIAAEGRAPTIQDDADGGVVQMKTDGDDGDHVSIQLNGESFYLVNGRRCYFETRVKFTNTTQNAMIGLASNATDPYATKPADYICFGLSGDADIEIQTGKGGTEIAADNTAGTDTGSDITAATWHTLAFEYIGDGQTVTFFLDGTRIYKHVSTTTVPDGHYLSPIFCIESTGTAEETIDIDYVLVVNERG
jgi:hypothetical protein